MVPSAGLNVYPEDLEAALRKQAGVRDCTVIPFDRGGNAEPCAVLLMKDAERPAARAAIESANSSLAEYQRVRMWIVWPEFDFPRTPTGKPRLSVIAARAAQILEGRQDDLAERAGADFSTRASSPSALDQLLDRFSGTRSGGSRADS